MKTKVFSFLLLILFCSCQKEKKEELLGLQDSIELEAIENPQELIIKNPWGLKQIGKKLLLINVANTNHVINVLNTESGEITQQWGIYGNGPGEFTSSLYWGCNDKKQTIFLFDQQQSIIREYRWDDTTENIHFTLLHETPFKKDAGISLMHGNILDNDNFVTNAIYGIEKPILILNSKLDSLTALGGIPDEAHQSTVLFSYDTRFAACGNKFVAGMLNLGHIALYEQKAGGEIEKLWEHFLEKPKYKDTRLMTEELKQGFYGLTMNDKYIFASYSGIVGNKENIQNQRLSPEHILMFNHKGKLLHNFHTKGKHILKILISDDGKTLFAVTDSPEISIVRYDISRYI